MVKKTYLKLTSPVQYIKGIGPKRASYLKKISVETVNDLLFLVPRRYLDYSTIKKIANLKINDEATIIGRIRLVEVKRTRQRGDILSLLLSDDTGSIVLKWFNRPDLKRKFRSGDLLLASGKVSFFQSKQFINPLYDVISEEDLESKIHGAIIPIYPLTEGLSLWDIRRAVNIAVSECARDLGETIPPSISNKHNLMRLDEAIMNLHFPKQVQDAVQARQRLVYEEFFYFELALARRKAKIKNETGIALRETGHLTRRFLESLPFSLTAGQRETIRQISCDMSSPRPMNRLLQGDVGSGKTVVALYALLIAAENGYQGALMAPTEILAEQHFINHSQQLNSIGTAPVLLTSSIKGSDRDEVTARIQDGTARIVFGTHALIEEGIGFNKLGIAVIDEQHRFGVMQRAALVNKGLNPDFLVLSATPIPRTLALTLYGDLDISTLTAKPPGRGEITTRIVSEKEKTATYQFINQQLSSDRQAFVICPLIERSEKLDLRSVDDVYREINSLFSGFSVGVIHGRLPTRERIEVMQAFRRGELKILVATTVIEVGVDIPNATLMLIQHPERFGLAQLHQLRGRIGRGAEKSFCFLFLDRFVAPETYERITFFAHNNDGFALARKDMILRGPGEILGSRQHGLPDIRFGDIESDQDLLFKARDDAFDVISHDPDIALAEHGPIRKKLQMLADRERLLGIG